MPIQGDAAAVGRPTYTFVRNLGGGGQHTQLVIAHHAGFDMECVEKTVFLTGPPDVLFAEPRLLEKLRGDDIVHVLDAQFDPMSPSAATFIMPYYPDGTILEALVDGHQFSLSEVVAITADILTGMTKLHDLGYIHGDIKPGNVMLKPGKGRGALGDVGSAAKADPSGMAAMGINTFLYLGPECFPSGNKVSRWSDLYAVGLTAFEMLAGPFDYAQLSPLVTVPRLQRGLRAMPETMLPFPPRVPRDLRLAIARAIAVDPKRRYVDARGFLKALRKPRFIDWRRTAIGPNRTGMWEGTYPPHMPVRRRRTYRIDVRAIKAGKLRVTARQRLAAGGPWRRFGLPDQDLGVTDIRGLSRIFAAVEDRARQSIPPK